MNNAAQPSSKMVSKIKSSFLSSYQSTAPANQNADSQADGSQANQAQQTASITELSDSQKIAVFEQVLDQIENENSLNPTHGVNIGGKEAVEISTSPDQASVDAGAAVQYVEHEKNPEIPVEVEGYLQKVEDFADENPPEIFIADGTEEQSDTSYPSRPVVVLPISQKVEEEGSKKAPSFSVRWLVEWSHKIVKMFAGKVIYKEEPA